VTTPLGRYEEFIQQTVAPVKLQAEADCDYQVTYRLAIGLHQPHTTVLRIFQQRNECLARGYFVPGQGIVSVKPGHHGQHDIDRVFRQRGKRQLHPPIIGKVARTFPRLLWIAAPLACFSYLYKLSAVGIIGPDEPRYAAIAREMARSGDWISPRLWGEGWYEKPPLLYWLSGLAFKLGLGSEIAPRLPVVLLALGFLAFYWWILNREFGCRPASFATLILGTCGGWMGISQVGVTDIPLTVTFSGAMLLTLPWIARCDARFLPVASVLLALAVLAKSGVPVVLMTPLAWWVWRGRSSLQWSTIWRVVVVFLVIAIPWHVLCYLANGRVFVYTLFVQHQLQRFTSGALLHTQPWWYYLPVMLGLLLPWTPLLLLVVRRDLYRDPRTQFLLAWVVFGFVFFSAASNKLAGYVLPLFPAAAALMALGLDRAVSAGRWLAACALLLVTILIAVPLLPVAVSIGLTHAPRPVFEWHWLLPGALALAAWLLDRQARRLEAILTIAVGALAAILYVKQVATPALDRAASARSFWTQIASRRDSLCVESIRRNFQYGLNYYSEVPLPECASHPAPLHIVQPSGTLPFVNTAAKGTVDLH
jgi:4-amino-4-deoxy-L-arabinose transferase-like glycosyltransferase